jgi:hypothetical protein
MREIMFVTKIEFSTTKITDYQSTEKDRRPN